MQGTGFAQYKISRCCPLETDSCKGLQMSQGWSTTARSLAMRRSSNDYTLTKAGCAKQTGSDLLTTFEYTTFEEKNSLIHTDFCTVVLEEYLPWQEEEPVRTAG